MNLIDSLFNAFLQNKENQAFCINDVFYTYKDLLVCINKARKIIKDNIDNYEKFI